MRNTRRAVLASLTTLVVGLAAWRPWRVRAQGIVGLEPRTIPGNRYRKLRVGRHEVYIREDLLAAGVLSDLRSSSQKRGAGNGR